jgi:hypothetical protein
MLRGENEAHDGGDFKEGQMHMARKASSYWMLLEVDEEAVNN